MYLHIGQHTQTDAQSIYISLLACKPMASCNISCGGGAKKNRNLEGPVAQSHLVHPDLRKSWATAG